MNTARMVALVVLSAAIIIAPGAGSAVMAATPPSGGGTGTGGGGNTAGGSAFPSSAPTTADAGFDATVSGLDSGTGLPSASTAQKLGFGATGTTGTTTAGRAAAGKGGAGVVPTMFIRDAKELAAIVAAACRKAPASPADEATVRDLVESMASDDTARRESAAKRLGELAGCAVGPLVDVLQNEETPPARRLAAARLLALIGYPAAPALAPLVHHSLPEVRLAAAEALSAIGGYQTAAPLTEALADPHEPVRLEAVQGLGNLRLTSAAVALSQVTQKDASPDVRVAAVHALGRIGSRSTVEPLIACLSDTQPRIRHAAAKALASMSDRLVLGACGELARLKSAGALTNALSDRDVSVRATAAEALGKLRDARAVGPLTVLLGDASTRTAAIVALGRIGGSEAQTALEKLSDESNDEALRRAAADAIDAMRRR